MKRHINKAYCQNPMSRLVPLLGWTRSLNVISTVAAPLIPQFMRLDCLLRCCGAARRSGHSRIVQHFVG
jgi:hypothetical protein